MSKQEKTPRMPKVWEALIPMLFLVAMLVIGIFTVDEVHMPMFMGAAGASFMAMYLGYKWSDIEKMMMTGINKALQSVLILLIVGILIGVWINAGIVPAMIYYGLQILKPAIFFVATLLIVSITSLATGTSWGAMGTVGVALMGIGIGLGLNPGMIAGAIISGAYFGDKMSPLSDTTNLAPAMAGTDVMSHVKAMIKPTAVTYGVALIFYAILGFILFKGGDADISQVQVFSDAIASQFTINPLLLIPPIIVIVAVACKMPAIPGITLGIISGIIFGLIFQKNDFGSYMVCAYSGFTSASGVAEIDDLLTSGGLTGMFYSVSMTIIAMMFGGIMEGTHMLEVMVNKLKSLAKGPVGLVTLTEATCLVSNATMPEQYVSIVVPGSMYSAEYAKMELHPTVLSSALEGCGTVSSALIPWNTCGMFILSTLGVTVSQYGIWAVFNWLMPIVTIIFACGGWSLKDLDGKPYFETHPKKNA